MAQPHPRTQRLHRFMVTLEVLALAGFPVVMLVLGWQVARGLLAVGLVGLPVLLLVPAGAALAALLTAFVHFLADNFGDESTPILGPAFVFRFRQHHDDPQLICTLSFREINGPGALLATPPLVLVALFVPIADTTWGLMLGALAGSMLGFGAATNQIHRWAHQPRRPRVITWLQKSGFILSPKQHGRHHRAPHDVHFGITNGWLDGFLDRTRAWHRVTELLVALGAGQASESVMGGQATSTRRPERYAAGFAGSARRPRP